MNYDRLCEQIIEQLKTSDQKKTLLLHACCAPCSSSVLERLESTFAITMFYYNPNITEEVEYQKRKEELKKFIQMVHPTVKFLDCSYDKPLFLTRIKGLEQEKEGGKRCYQCYLLRLQKTAEMAQKYGFDYFGTTLSVSPYKKSTWLNAIGRDLEAQYGVSYLYSNFKKKDGYKRSIELSFQYHLYRQNYCGCIFSKMEQEHVVKGCKLS